MKVSPTPLPGILLIEPRVFGDDRGHFFEAWSNSRYGEAGLEGPFVQDNLSVSRRGVLRGLHYQHPNGQGKLVTVLDGSVYDVVVDIRRGSATFGRWWGTELDGESHRQLWVPPGFAHGFLVTGDRAVFSYKCTEYYRPADEGSVRWDDPDLAIAWPDPGPAGPVVSGKDRDAPLLRELAPDRLPALADVGPGTGRRPA